MPFEVAMFAGATIGVLVGFGLLLVALGRKLRNRSLIERGRKVQGSVVRSQRPSGARPVAFEYQDDSGRTHHLVDGLAVLLPSVGERVEVSYDPQNPERAVVNAVADRQNGALLTLAALSFAISIMLILSAFVLGPELGDV